MSPEPGSRKVDSVSPEPGSRQKGRQKDRRRTAYPLNLGADRTTARNTACPLSLEADRRTDRRTACPQAWKPQLQSAAV
ncbi:hypothetical protein PBY51_004745 [Eleginops maclovinus]|uniref:Uncharacterized protein n=1 Tax=Eleginops maclovinus TaxID=56733 RepID=A0AAN7X5W0_ELEMC|nr:hypothetical protein PBY51_004745 [Eleginops maclovinus]